MTKAVVRVAAGLLVGGDRKVLYAQRMTSVLCGGMWEYPGGKLEDRETSQDALRREWREETGQDCVVGALVGTCQIELDDVLAIGLYRVYLQGTLGALLPIGNLGYRWLSPQEAVRTLHLVPSCYLLYTAVREHLRRHKPGIFPRP